MNVADMSKYDKIVKTIEYVVPDAVAGEKFLVSVLGAKYDYKGAVGLAIAPTRKWDDEDSWFCYELAGACLKAAGSNKLNSLNHVTEIALFAISDD
jgi:hypothetical protein